MSFGQKINIDVIKGNLEKRFASEGLSPSQDELERMARSYYFVHGVNHNQCTYDAFIEIYKMNPRKTEE